MDLKEYLTNCLLGLEGANVYGTVEFKVSLDERGKVSSSGTNSVSFTVEVVPRQTIPLPSYNKIEGNKPV